MSVSRVLHPDASSAKVPGNFPAENTSSRRHTRAVVAHDVTVSKKFRSSEVRGVY
jgi:hypothetical protein